MITTETLLNSHRFTNALFTKIASTLSQKPLLKKGAFYYPLFPGIPVPFLQRCPSAYHGHSRTLFPFSSFSPKGNRSGLLSARFPDKPGIPRPAVRNQSSSDGQPAATRHEKTVRQDISNISKTRAPKLCLHETATGTCQPDRSKRHPLPVLPAPALP
jgi:hypothetical protein